MVILENFEECLQKQYHSYPILKFLNNFKYFHREEANENDEIHNLI